MFLNKISILYSPILYKKRRRLFINFAIILHKCRKKRVALYAHLCKKLQVRTPANTSTGIKFITGSTGP